MKSKLLILMVIFSALCTANAMTVKAADISGKTDLVAVTDATVNGKKETILVDKAGISLYIFARDSKGVSTCSGACLKEWPPMHVPANPVLAPPFGVIKGHDGLPQLTLNGIPLHHYDDDKKPGDVFGQYPEWSAIQVEK
jgi:predicted lipoprotein with Yx(FWY)xxD motif